MDLRGEAATQYLHFEPSWLDPGFGSSSLRLHDVSVWRPANVTSALGQLFGASVGRGNALSAPVTLVTNGAVAEFRDGLRFTGANEETLPPRFGALHLFEARAHNRHEVTMVTGPDVRYTLSGWLYERAS